MSTNKMVPALQLLVDAGYLNVDQASETLNASAATGRPVARIMRELGLTRGLPAARIPPGLDYPFVDLVDVTIEPQALAAVPAALARRHLVLPVAFEGDRLVIAMPDPTNVIAIDDIRTITGREVKIVLAEPAAIRDGWTRQSALDRSAETLLEQATTDQEDETTQKQQEELESAEDAPIVRAINQIIAQAVQQRASDLHIEPQERDVSVRFRLDGVLHEVMRIPKPLHAGVTSRLKVMAELNIAERRLPQDGRISLTVEGNPIDLRVATVPSVWGEEVILRILDRGQSLLTLPDLGFPEDTLGIYERAFRRPHGAILVVGPTGSGKSTTLYSTLNVVNHVSKKIITVEDPVEYRLPGMTQIHVNAKAGLNFANALRSILRSDPDIIMVGEIRDTETARIAIEAALTGHLVFTTLHTNDAPGALTRLVEMGVEPFLVASSVECVLAQRLGRKLCSRCREPYTPSAEVVRECGFGPDEDLVFYRPKGCNQCSGTGYRGRIAMVELMPVNEEIERMTVERSSSDELRRAAVEHGMRTLREDGMIKVRAGVTSIEEVLRIVEGRVTTTSTGAQVERRTDVVQMRQPRSG